MFFKKFVSLLVATASIGVVVLGLLGCFPDVRVSLPFVSEGPVSSLTGLPGTDGPVLVVKIDDTNYAHPQVGLSSADVVYIEQVEGGLTRLAAVFASKIPELVGPVRSARISDIELFSQYGKVGFAYSGAQKKMFPVLAAASLYDVGATHYGPTFYFNEPTRIAPYAMMLRAPELILEAKNRGTEFVKSSSMGWNFGKTSTELKEFASVHISWPASSYDASWSSEESRWLLTHNGEVDLDDAGQVLGPKTFVIQLVSITDSIYHDKVGGVTPFSATVGEGKCYILRNNGYIPCLWSRPTSDSGTRFTDLAGEEVPFEKGQIWFALTAREPVFTFSSLQDATSQASK